MLHAIVDSVTKGRKSPVPNHNWFPLFCVGRSGMTALRVFSDHFPHILDRVSALTHQVLLPHATISVELKDIQSIKLAGAPHPKRYEQDEVCIPILTTAKSLAEPRGNVDQFTQLPLLYIYS